MIEESNRKQEGVMPPLACAETNKGESPLPGTGICLFPAGALASGRFSLDESHSLIERLTFEATRKR